MECKIIAHIETDFDSKFGVPRQAGLIPELEGRIVFEPEYRSPTWARRLFAPLADLGLFGSGNAKVFDGNRYLVSDSQTSSSGR